MNIKLIGIGGTNGSGKDTLGDILAQDYGFLAVSVSDFLREEAKKRGLPIEREYLRTISAGWRRDHGVGVLVDKAIQKFKKENKGGKYRGLVAIPMRNPGEAKYLESLGGVLVWVDADPKVRYRRIYARGRSTEDQKTYKQFLAEEYDEMHHHGGDEATLSGSKVKAMAGIFIQNDSDDIEDLKSLVKKALKDHL